LSEGSDEGFSRERAELFEALGHPLRLEILRALSESPLGFADLKRRVNITSSGHLTHHLEKLDGLVKTTPEGLYALTDDGKEALRIASTLAPTASTAGGETEGKRRIVASRAVLAVLISLVIVVAAVAIVEGLGIADLTIEQKGVMVTNIHQFLTTVSGRVPPAAVNEIYAEEDFPGNGLSLSLGATFNATISLDVTPYFPGYSVENVSADDGFVVVGANVDFPQIVSTVRGPLYITLTLKAPAQPYRGAFDLYVMTAPLDQGLTDESVLQLTAQIMPDSAAPGQNVSVVASVRNVLTRQLTLYHSAMGNPAIGPCSGVFMVRVEVFQGHYALPNQTYGSQLLVYDPYAPTSCPPISGLDSTFLPQEVVNETSVFNGYWTTEGQNATFHNFLPGNYTVMVQDYWGQLVLLYFTVS
jgi:DNA-binding HxlR family transcriptional regulator